MEYAVKRNLLVTALFTAALAAPVFAQDKPAPEAPKADATKANSPTKRHSHQEDRQGIKPSTQTTGKKEPVDKKLHSHPRDRSTIARPQGAIR